MMALEEIQAVTARIASIDQRMQQLATGLTSAPALGTALSTPLGGTTAGAGTQPFDQVLGRTMATASASVGLSTSPAVTVGSPTSPTVDRALDFASQQLGDPYVFGAEGPDAWDCSSLVQSSFRSAGVELPRTASEQARAGTAVPVDRAAVRPGDLIFMRGGQPTHDLGHVGIAISAEEFVVAPHRGANVQVQAIPWSRVQRVRRVA